MAGDASRAGTNLFQDWMDAINNQRGQLDLRLEHVQLKLPFIPDPVELNGTVTMSFHVRELSPREREASAAKEVRQLRSD
jgi:hypothetical protein